MAINVLQIIRIEDAIKKKSKEKLHYYDFDIQNRKYSDDDLLEYFISAFENRVNHNNKVSDNILDKYLFSIYLVIKYCYINKLPLEDSLLQKTLDFKKLYMDYTQRLNLEANQVVVETCKKIYDLVTLNYVLNEENITFSAEEKYKIVTDKDMDEYKEKIRKLELENDCLAETAQISKSSLEKIRKEKRELQEELKNLKKQVSDANHEVERLTGINKNKENTIASRQDELERAKSSLEKEKINVINLHAELDKASKTIEEQESLLKGYRKVCGNEEDLKIALYEIAKLTRDSSYSLEELTMLLRKKKIDVTLNDVSKLVRELKQYIYITSTGTTIPASYEIKPLQSCETNSTYKINNIDKTLDIMLFSDVHIIKDSSKTYNGFDALYNYCKKHDIKYIFNLGDLFDFNYNFEKKSRNLDEFKKTIEVFLKHYPFDKDIYNAYLGGNHEKRVLNDGIDTVNLLSSIRSDFTPLGYSNATIILKEGKIKIHHPNKVTDKEIKSAVLSYLKDYYKSAKRDNCYIDLVGHYHRSYLSLSDSYYLVPSLTNNLDSEDGATHLKIYFDNSGKIDRIIFIPLIFKNKLMSAGEMEYKKILK